MAYVPCVMPAVSGFINFCWPRTGGVYVTCAKMQLQAKNKRVSLPAAMQMKFSAEKLFIQLIENFLEWSINHVATALRLRRGLGDWAWFGY